MQSEGKRMLKETAILFVITLLSGALLGFVYELTKEPIRIQQEKAIEEACLAVLPGAQDAGTVFHPIEHTLTPELAEELAANGIKELIIIAQDTTKYGYKLYYSEKSADGNGSEFRL